MRTPSLRRRVVLWSTGVLAALLLVVGVGVDLTLGAVLKAEQHQRLESIAALASELTGLSDQALADRLSMPGIEAQITYASGDSPVVGTPQAPSRGHRGPPEAVPPARTDAAVTVTEEGGRLVATQALRPGVELELITDDAQNDAALVRFRVIMAVASVLAVGLAAALLPLVLRRAMRPLEALTAAARATAAGSRGRRLGPEDPGTDLGRAAAQFDAMLEELEGAERRAEESAERLGRFLSDASHELRTPLAGISAGAERLIREPLDDAQRDRVTVLLVREARRAGRLVDDLLLVSRLGRLDVRPRPLPIGPALQDAVDRTGADGPLVRRSGPDATAVMDRERVDQVLANLVANARNAGARTVLLRTRVVGAEVEVRVSDDGPGIPVEAREAVFERLVRLDPARSSANGGAGLGLPIARGLLEAQAGTLDCVDPEGEDLPGAVLRIRLPLALPVAPEPAPAPRAVSSTTR